ncbi:MAG: LTA synthase family protein [Prevotella sp.]
MKRLYQSLLWLISIHIVGLLVFSLFRFTEFVCLHSQIVHPEASIFGAFIRGVWFDNVIGCYILLVPLVVAGAAAVVGRSHRLVYRFTAWWFSILYALAFMASAANTPYFAYFFKNINSSIFLWFGYTATTAGMLFEEKSYWLYILLYFLLAGGFVWTVFKLTNIFRKRIEKQPADSLNVRCIAGRGIVWVLAVLLCLFGIRGRRGYNPIKVSEAYYCDDSFLNQLGINPSFNLLTSVLDDLRKENRELHLMPYAEAISYARASLGIQGRVDSNYVLRRRVVSAISPRRHNVVVILMESMSASLLKTFGQPDELTPTLDSLYRCSLAFTNCYSAGIHTNHGLTASLYSFPALMFRNLMKGTVTPHREGIPTVLRREGYHNMFFMTHEAQYDNMKAFFSTNGYDDIYSQENYPRDSVVNSFGVGDHFEMDFALGKINAAARRHNPFLATILTISNHPPYKVPTWFHARSKEAEKQIVEYADWSIGQFLKAARREPWYRNTVFVIYADHGKMVGKADGELPVSYNHIPLLIFGPDVKPQLYDGLAQQVDIVPTVLGLLGLSYDYDGFGVDLLKTRRQMVFYSADNQVVARDYQHCFVYNPSMQKAFCYDALPGWKLRESHDTKAFTPLRKYVFAMEQTAQFMLNRQR